MQNGGGSRNEVVTETPYIKKEHEIMALKYHILNSSGRFDSHLELLREQVEQSIETVNKHLSMDADVCISHSSAHCNKELGIGGGAFTPNLMHIFLDVDHKNFVNAVKTEILCVLAHEAHHCKRMESVPNDYSLIDSIVTEGLACQCELDIGGGENPSFIPDSVIHDTNSLLSIMLPHLEETEYCFDTYFLGKDPEKLPKYAGFAVGFDIVGRYLKANGMSAAEAASVPAIEFLPYASAT